MIGDKDLSVASKMMDLCALRHKLLANNIANADVRGYRRRDISFSNELQKALENADPQRVASLRCRVRQASQPGVDPERETARMAKNELLFDAFSRIAAHKIRMLRTAVRSK